MEKFGMNFGGGPSKKDLLETIESQKKQLLQYQARLKDVVRAYKSLLKEKEALEASLKVLSASQEAEAGPGGAPPAPSPPCTDPADDQSSERSSDSAGTADAGGEAGEGPGGSGRSGRAEETSGSESGLSTGSADGGPGEADRRVLRLRAQLATLTGALSTVTQEKSRMEASYQADKRQMKRELEEAAKAAEEERGRLGAELRGLQEQLAETRARLAAQQQDRAREQGDHAAMLRELQRLLQAERGLRRQAELRLGEGGAGAAQGHELQVRRLSQEVEELKRELRAVQEESDRPDPRIQALQEEMAGLKSHFQVQLLQEMKKTAQAEEQLRQHAQREERRLAELERQVSEASDLLGTYEKAKQKDQGLIQKLKERIVQLDLENKTLAIAASSRSPLDPHPEDASLDVNVLRDRMEKLKKLLQEAGKGQPAEEVEKLCELELPRGGEAGDGEKASALYYQQELKQLKEEFERYKVRAQVVLKNKSAKDGSLAKELEEAQEQLAALREQHAALQLSCQEEEGRQRRELEARGQELARLQQRHRQELERCRREGRDRALRLEEELHRQRERALALLAEKDQELQHLRALTLPQGSRARPAPGADLNGEDPAGGECPESLPQALQLSSEPTLFLYAEQLARKEVEIATLRKQRHRLETQVHQLQEEILAQGEKHREEVSALRSEIEKSCRDRGREGANLEYLKNVVYRFLTLPESLGRQQTLGAILTILHFSPEEKQSVAKHSACGSWWLSGKR